ncbi:hypothetical protein EV195_102105 [Tenacibaculum skagerrakense]|uniref:Uncharacterized protein n=1 Tax=Tenacibaculum skagerrakense TaxID=186571 RepID=A0A4R2NYP6_9FLAO|nr:hypothetical protein EV195_102105 [Tenacibaculum skagerrakense]
MNSYIIAICVVLYIFFHIWVIKLNKKNKKEKLPKSNLDKDYEFSIDKLFEDIFKKFK